LAIQGVRTSTLKFRVADQKYDKHEADVSYKHRDRKLPGRVGFIVITFARHDLWL
jgi:hypothetical protein